MSVAGMVEGVVTTLLVAVSAAACLVAASPEDIMPRRRGPDQYLRVPLGELLIADDPDDGLEVGKRQFDDYGHMRFGKRGDPEDDYGHMRFGRGHG